MSDFQYKEEVKTYKKTRKSVTFIDIQTYESDTKTLSYTIRLSVTIKEHKGVPLLSERLHSLLKTSKVHEVRLLDCGKEKWIDFFSS